MFRRIISTISSDLHTESALKNNLKYCHTTSLLRGSRSKGRKYEFINADYLFVPLAFVTLGPWSLRTNKFLKDIPYKINAATGDKRAGSFLAQSKGEYQPVADFYSGKSVFITGGTGALGKILIERLLFNCTEIDKVYVLVRKKRGVEAEERLKDIFDNVLFSKLKQVRPKDVNKIVPIVGDISAHKLGITPKDENTLVEKVSVVFHSAADVRLNLPMKRVIKLNVEGTKELLNLSRQMKNIQAFVYISTAFSNADHSSIIDETVYPPPRKLRQVYEFIKSGEVDTENFLNGKPNSYTFSKALAESVVAEQHGNIPTVIIRPSMICCVKNEPIPGWIDNWYGPTGLIYYASIGLNRVIPGKKTTPMNLIPADYTANLTIVAATRCGKNKEVKVYNSCTSPDQPLMWSTLVAKFVNEYQKLDSGNGKQAKVFFSASPRVLSILTFVLHKVPAYCADSWLYLRGKEPRFIKELFRVLAVRDLVLYFASNTFIWSVNNVRDLYWSLSPNDRKRFPFDPSEKSWNEYIKLYCAGVYKYLVNKNKL